MLPDAYYCPVVVFEDAVGFGVPLPVSRKLSTPKSCICFRTSAMLRTGMPKTAVDIDGNPRRSKDDICARPHPRNRGTIDAESKSAAVKLRAKGKLRRGIAVTDVGHLRALRR